MSTHALRSLSRLSPTTRAVKPIPNSSHHKSTFTVATRALLNNDIAPLDPRLFVSKKLPSFLPKLSMRDMASGSASPRPGPILARAMSDPTFYAEADTESKVAVEKAVAEEKLQTYFGANGADIVNRGPLHLMTPACGGNVPADRTAVWHVRKDGQTLKGVYIYAHAGDAADDGFWLRMKRALGDEFKEAGTTGAGLKNWTPFGIVQVGGNVSFYQYDGGS